MTNSKILKEVISGNKSSLAFLIDKYKDIAFNIAIGIVKNKEDAKDITQDSFLKVLENIQSFRNESKFSTWLYRIVYNTAIQHIRKNRKLDSIDNFTHKLVDNSTELFEFKVNDQILKDALNTLDKNERTIITLFYLGEKSMKEINTITGLTISNIKVILFRTRKKLKDLIKTKYERY